MYGCCSTQTVEGRLLSEYSKVFSRPALDEWRVHKSERAGPCFVYSGDSRLQLCRQLLNYTITAIAATLLSPVPATGEVWLDNSIQLWGYASFDFFKYTVNIENQLNRAGTQSLVIQNKIDSYIRVDIYLGIPWAPRKGCY